MRKRKILDFHDVGHVAVGATQWEHRPWIANRDAVSWSEGHERIVWRRGETAGADVVQLSRSLQFGEIGHLA